MQNSVLILAQGFGLGRIPIAPGTFGSLPGLLWLMLLMQTRSVTILLFGLAAGILLSVWVCGAGERILKQRDPSSIVFDEIVALPVGFLPWVLSETYRHGHLPEPGFLLQGWGWLATLVLFVLFRAFDVLKPWPVGPSQTLHGGWGVTMDDVLAGLYVALISLPFVI